MRGKVLLAISFILLLSLSKGVAQDSNTKEAPLPTAPFISPLPNYATWTMTVVPLKPAAPSVANAGAQAPMELKLQQGAQTKKIRQEINTWSDNSTSQNWIIGNKRLIEDPVKHGIIVVDPDHDMMAGYYARQDFLNIKWLSLDTYVHVETYQKHVCYLFRKKAVNPPPAIASPTHPPIGGYEHVVAQAPGQAWIDVTTKQMVAYNDGDNVYTFDYGSPPTAELVLPPAFAKVWQRFQDDMNPLKVPVPPTR